MYSCAYICVCVWYDICTMLMPNICLINCMYKSVSNCVYNCICVCVCVCVCLRVTVCRPNITFMNLFTTMYVCNIVHNGNSIVTHMYLHARMHTHCYKHICTLLLSHCALSFSHICALTIFYSYSHIATLTIMYTQLYSHIGTLKMLYTYH